MSRWFRFYDEMLDDPKVQQLSDALYRRWTDMLCVASRNGGMITGDMKALAFMIRQSPSKTQAAVTALVAAGLIDRHGDDYTPHNWAGRQYASDSSAERMRRHRDAKRDADVTSHVTLRDAKSDAADQSRTETDTETEQSRAESLSRAKARATKLPAGWKPSDATMEWIAENAQGLGWQIELDRMTDWAVGNAKRKADWDATFRNWIRKARDEQRGRKPSVAGPGHAGSFKNGYAAVLRESGPADPPQQSDLSGAGGFEGGSDPLGSGLAILPPAGRS